FGNLSEHSRRRRLVIIKTTARHPPPTGDGSAAGILGGEQAPARDDHCVRRKSLPDRWSHLGDEQQPSASLLSSDLRTWLVDYGTHQQSEYQTAGAVAGGIDRTDDDVAPIEREHLRIGTVIEKHLERVPTMLRDADDQHVVIIAQKVDPKGASDAAV